MLKSEKNLNKEIKKIAIEGSNEGCSPTELATKIAECAYYRAEKRGFIPGYEMEDWYEAEEEILTSRYGI